MARALPIQRFIRGSALTPAFALAALLTACAGGGSSVPAPAPGGATSAPTALATTPSAAGASPSASSTATPSGATPSASSAATAAASAPAGGVTAVPTAAATVAPGSTPGPGGLPTPTPAPTVFIANVETPLAADSLADSVGLNAKTASLYTQSDFSTIVSLEAKLGVRHLRDGILNGMSDYDAAESRLLDATGAKVDGVADCASLSNTGAGTSAASIQAFDSAIGNRMEAYEGPNEPDNRGDSTWVIDTLGCLPSLRMALPSTTFIAPSLADPNDDASQLGNISSYVDEGNIHRYFAGHNPGSLGWGGQFSCGTYGALAWAICLAQINSSTSKPVVVTETGYNSQTEVDETTQAKYLTRALFVNLKGGIGRTYLYDVDDYAANVDAFAGDGLIHTDDSVKPSYRAIQNAIAFFDDPGTALARLPLAFDLENKTLSHQLFEKIDGDYVLALWNETPSWNTSTQTAIAVAPIAETIDFELPPTGVSAVSFADDGTLVSKTATLGGPTVRAGATVTVAIDDHVTLVTFGI